MQIGGVIRKYRKEKQMTQEELAGALGVTAPAVNKWENGNSYPDISLLGPLARLLGITTDVLLSYKENLSDREIHTLLETIGEKAKAEGFDAAFAWTEGKIREYPNCIRFILYAAQSLYGYKTIFQAELPEKYEEKLLGWLRRCAESTEPEIQQNAAVILFMQYMEKKDYQKAQECLNLLPERGFNGKQLQANLYVQQGKKEEAYRIYEQLLFGCFQDAGAALSGILRLCIEEDNLEKAEKIVEKQKKLAEIFEMGKYQEASAGLELAVYKKDRAALLKQLAETVENIGELDAFRSSELYSHIGFKENGTGEILYMLKKTLETDEELAFVREEPEFARIQETLAQLVKKVQEKKF